MRTTRFDGAAAADLHSGALWDYLRPFWAHAVRSVGERNGKKMRAWRNDRFLLPRRVAPFPARRRCRSSDRAHIELVNQPDRTARVQCGWRKLSKTWARRTCSSAFSAI